MATFYGGQGTNSGLIVLQFHNDLGVHGHLPRAAEDGELTHHPLTGRAHHHRHIEATEADVLGFFLYEEHDLWLFPALQSWFAGQNGSGLVEEEGEVGGRRRRQPALPLGRGPLCR